MKKYLVLVSFAGPDIGSFAAGEEIELTAEQAKQLEPFIEPLGKAKSAPAIETAELSQANVETADVKTPRSKKG